MERFTIFLIGFSGSGKTTIGRLLAGRTNSVCYDIDQLIEKKEKLNIADIFDTKSELYFRKCETEMIQKVISKPKKKKIISLGGGAFEKKENRSIISQNGITVYLSCSQLELYKRMLKANDRPLLNGSADLKSKINRLLNKRIVNYKKAEYTVSTTKLSPAQAADKIIKEILCR